MLHWRSKHCWSIFILDNAYDQQYRARNDIYNGVSAGFLTGAILARNAGPTAMLGGGVAFAAFSGAIDWWLRSAPAEYAEFFSVYDEHFADRLHSEI